MLNYGRAHLSDTRRRFVRELRQKTHQLPPRHGPLFWHRTSSQAHHDIKPAQSGTPKTKNLPDDTLHAITVNGPWRDFLAGDYAEPGQGQSVGPGEHGKMPAHPDWADS